MKSIQNQYRDLKEGRMSQANFMRNLRMTMPQYVTNVTSFNDAVKILKNKSILTEAALGENNLLDELESEMEDGNSYAEAISKVAAKYNMNEDDLATKYPEEAVGNKAYADNYNEPVDDSDVDWTNEADDEIKTDEEEEILAMLDKMDQEKKGEEAIMSQYDPMEEAMDDQIDPNDVYSGSSVDRGETGSRIEFRVVKNTPEYFTIDYKIIPNSRFVSRGTSKNYQRRVEEGTKVIYKDQVNPAQRDYIKVDSISFQINNSQLVDMLYSNVAEELNEGKGKDLHPNQIHPQELRMGIKVELEHTDDLDKAKKIALDHLAENPFYYTALKMSGIESPSVFTAKAPVKKDKKKDSIQLVDLANQMKKVKMPKAEEKKKLKEARYNIDDEPNAAAKQAMQFVDGNATLKALSDDIEIQQSGDDAILRFGYWDALPANAIEKLKLQFDVEVMSDFDEDTGEIIAYRLTPLRRNYGGKDLGASFEKFKSQLEEVVREVVNEMQSDDQEIDNMAMAMDETFDGRDNIDAKNID